MRSSRVRPLILLLLVLLAPPAFSPAEAQQPPRAAQDEFVPIDQLPQDERLPAARLLIAAYAAAWVLVAGYLWSIWRRLARVERELAEVGRRIPSSEVDHPKSAGGRGGR